MAFDDSSVYVLEPSVLQTTFVDGQHDEYSVERAGRILKCPITGCSNPQVLYNSTTEFQMKNLVVDDRFVYFAGNYCTPGDMNSNGWYDACAFIATIPK